MAKSRTKILVVGSINMDMVFMTPRLPDVGETILGTGFFMNPGGKGANQAVAAARLGAIVNLVGCIGNDNFGDQLVKALKKENVGTDNIGISRDKSTGVAGITVNQKGENAIVVASGANMEVNKELLEKGEALFKDADIILVQLEIPLEMVKKAVEMAKTFNKYVILNPAPACQLQKDILRKIDIITPNKSEGLALTDNKGELEDEDIIRQIINFGAKKVILTRGGQGIIYNDERGRLIKKSAFKVNAIDTTGAGDCFNGALAVSLAEGNSLSDAIDFAQKASSICVQKKGALHSLPYRSQIKF